MTALTVDDLFRRGTQTLLASWEENVGTLEYARGRGLGKALTTLLAHDALACGCRTASLQSTPMAEGVYASVGFRDLGRILEYSP
jgi:predicted GNAT family acetyltransferase